MIATAAEDQRTRERAKTSMEQATAIFAEKNIRFTDLRRKVFEEIASTQASVGAYEVLDRLAKKGTRLAPISVYRALDALLEAGVVHRLESKNAYFACRRMDKPRTGRPPIFLSCEKCGTVQESMATRSSTLSTMPRAMPSSRPAFASSRCPEPARNAPHTARYSRLSARAARTVIEPCKWREIVCQCWRHRGRLRRTAIPRATPEPRPAVAVIITTFGIIKESPQSSPMPRR